MLLKSHQRAFHCSSTHHLKASLLDLNVAQSSSRFLRTVLYGVRAPQEPIRDEERVTHSKRIARGKYVHELSFHDIKPECVERYQALVAEHYPVLRKIVDEKGYLAGAWKTMIGDLDQAIYLWEYKGYQGYEKAQEALQHHPKHQAFRKELFQLVRQRRNQICLEFAFWNTSPPQQKGGVYELRSYTLQPGNLLEWEMQWKRGLEVRKKFCQPVGAWFSQLGRLNTVHHMWVYPDLETRKLNREEAWKEEGWAETVHSTVPLIQDMTARILKPLHFSPLK